MSQTDTEQQIRIWKDLAISKQMLMNEAAAALKLKEDCTADELRSALDAAVKRAREADENMAITRAEADEKIEQMKREIRNVEKSRSEANAAREEAEKKSEAAEQQLNNGRRENAEALKRAKRQVEDKQKELKAINTALADTPDNILKKLKSLKKQKLDEATARKTAEDSNRQLKKQNKEQKEELTKLETLSENSGALVESFRALQVWAEAASGKLKEAAVDFDDLPTVDEELVVKLEALTTTEDSEEDTREAATA
ncbi:MAG: hypothetical protein KTR35_12295 [Gammaproteobacteria bacterium]|nr:hypothetical protein [Gammaproteobacteria bacterium]